MRYQCQKCYLVCRERLQPSPLPGHPDELVFAARIEEGYSLDQIAIAQAPRAFPLFIPTYTHKYKAGLLPLSWAAADMRILFKSRRKSGADVQPYFGDEEQARQYLRVNPSCQLLAVLNGPDWMLESFWAMPRQDALAHLAAIGFGTGTGATYSVTALTTAGTPVPYAHHTAMLLRHHRVLDEMQAAGMCATPNLYWLDGDLRELNRWADWLRNTPAVQVVSRDFTATTHWSVISKKVTELIYLLRRAGRRFHVLVVGSGRANAPRILRALANAGHTASIVTSAPILKALSGVKYELDANGTSSEAACEPDTYPFPLLIEHNLAVFEDILRHSVEGTPAAQAARNLPLSTKHITGLLA